MEYSIIKNAEVYFKILNKLISNNGMVDDPKDLKNLVNIRTANGKIIGWEIFDKSIFFQTFNQEEKKNFMKCKEFSIIDGAKYVIQEFNYHFNSVIEGILSYRIDHDHEGLHLNPDPSLKEIEHRILPDKIKVNIYNFNCVLAIYLALAYIKAGVYLTEDEASLYNDSLEKIRRSIN